MNYDVDHAIRIRTVGRCRAMMALPSPAPRGICPATFYARRVVLPRYPTGGGAACGAGCVVGLRYPIVLYSTLDYERKYDLCL